MVVAVAVAVAVGVGVGVVVVVNADYDCRYASLLVRVIVVEGFGAAKLWVSGKMTHLNLKP